MNIPGWVSFIGALLVLVATLAAVVAVARVSYNETRIKGLLGDVEDRDRRLDIVRSDLADTNAKLEKVVLELRAEKSKVRVLEGLVTGKEQLDHLQASLDGYSRQVHEEHAEFRESHKEMRSNQATIIASLKRIEGKLP